MPNRCRTKRSPAGIPAFRKLYENFRACLVAACSKPEESTDKTSRTKALTENWTIDYILFRDAQNNYGNWTAVPSGGGTFSLFIAQPYYLKEQGGQKVYASEGTIGLTAERDTIGDPSATYPLAFARVDNGTIPYTGGLGASFYISPNDTPKERKGCIVANYEGVQIRQRFTQQASSLPAPSDFSVAGYSGTSTRNYFYMLKSGPPYAFEVKCTGATWSCNNFNDDLVISKTAGGSPITPNVEYAPGTYYAQWNQTGGSVPAFFNIVFFCRGKGIDAQFCTRYQ